MREKKSIDTLKELLFEEEKDRYLKLSSQIKETSKEIDEKLANREIPEAEFNEILDRIVRVMPEKLGPTITSTLKVQIRESRDDVVQALFPIVGQMIKKYISQEIQLLTERLDKQFESVFSFDLFLLRLKSIFTGTPYGQLLIARSSQASIREIFIIEEESGLLLASYSKTPSFDQDMMAGMLTAIKTFVSDAMEVERQELEMISYDLFQIYIHNFHKFYIAVVIEGAIDNEYKNKLSDRLLSFVNDTISNAENSNSEMWTKQLKKHFDKI